MIRATKAVILAAGKGERLREITREIPKPMIPYRGRPVLEHNVLLCAKAGAEKIFINLHHLPDNITGHFGDGAAFGVRIVYSLERDLLGTAGALRKFRAEHPEDFQNPEERFFLLYGDNFSDIDLTALLAASEKNNALATVAFHYRKETRHSGVAEFDREGKILRFIEKPEPGRTKSRWVNAGVYCLKTGIIDLIPEGVSDFGKDLFPEMLRRGIPLFGLCTPAEVRAFDTMDMYNQNRE